MELTLVHAEGVMKRVYPAILTPTKKNILVEIPDLQILTEGKDLGDAIKMARDAIGLKGISLQDAGKAIPDASAAQEIRISKGTFAGEGEGLLTLVDIDFDIYRRKMDQKMVRRNVTLPNWLNVAAEEANINVSGVLQEALKKRLGFENN